MDMEEGMIDGLLHLLAWMHEIHSGGPADNPLIRRGIGLREGHP